MKAIMGFVGAVMLVIFSVIGTGGCDEHSAQRVPTDHGSARNDLKQELNHQAEIGILHTEGLKYVYDQLSVRRVNLESGNQIMEEILAGTNNFVQKKGGVVDKEYSSFVLPFTGFGKYRHNGSRGRITVVDSILEMGVFTEAQKSFIQRARKVSILRIPFSRFVQTLDKLDEEAVRELGNEHARPVHIFTSVYRASAEYWQSHVVEWIRLLEGSREKKLKKISLEDFPWDDVLAADATAAAAAAIPCIGASVGYLACVSGAAVGASLVVITGWVLSEMGLLPLK